MFFLHLSIKSLRFYIISLFMKKFLTGVILFFFLFQEVSAFNNYFIFWLRLQDNDYDVAEKIESQFNVKIPIISLIYDDFDKWNALKLAKTFQTLWNSRVYHISINPFWQNLKDLIEDKTHMWWETKYRNLFKIIKKFKVKVIFRSLHEMNWGWYSRSSDPHRFPIFWKMLWSWSREEWLDKSNILFDFSINSQDLPAVEWQTINQWTPVVTCSQEIKAKTWCFTFEDYYPGNEYVDIIWVTIYNWWSWARRESWATWRDPLIVINEPWYWTLDRMKKFNKPIFIDEAWTTSIKEDSFDNDRNIRIYNENHYGKIGTPAKWTSVKNDWISKLENLYLDNQVLGWAYFNADVTYWFTDRSKVWELDWTAIDPDKIFAYPNLIKILNNPRMLRNATLYFDINDKELEWTEGIMEDEMYSIQDFISKYIVYQEWNIITSGANLWKLKVAKYKKFLEEKISKDPVFCSFVNKQFPKIKCENITKDYVWFDDKMNVFKLLKTKINLSPIQLSNWWIWEQAEDLKKSLSSKLQNSKNLKQKESIKNMVNYLDYYEKAYLDLR